MPTALLIGVRINARRPRRARLVMVNTLITTTAFAAWLTGLAQGRQVKFGGSELAKPESTGTLQAMLLVIVVLCVLALINAIVSAWTAVLDARHPLAVARTLGATPAQVTVSMAVAQLLPAIPGVALGVPAGIGLYLVVSPGDPRYAPTAWMLALAAARRPVIDTLQSKPT